MNPISERKRKSILWLSPFAGAFLISIFLVVRVLIMNPEEPVIFDFFIWFFERLLVGYLCALPVLGIAYRLGSRSTICFMLLASLAALPLEYYTSIPSHAWSPTMEEAEHGMYWDATILSVILASATGWMFSRGVIKAGQAPKSDIPLQ